MSIQDIRTCYRIGELLDGFLENLRVRSAHVSRGEAALDGDMTIEALPTWYAGVTFRSRLEADWAATLDTLNIAWEYEPERITLPSGTVYIPDFWLPKIGTWLEVKGTGVPRIEKALELGEARACHCDGDCTCEWPGGELVIIGHPSRPYVHELPPDPDWIDYLQARVSERKHGGHPVWSPAHGRPPWLTRCRHCDRGCWFTKPWCRACDKRLIGRRAYRSGEAGLELIEAGYRPAPKRLELEAEQPDIEGEAA